MLRSKLFITGLVYYCLLCGETMAVPTIDSSDKHPVNGEVMEIHGLFFGEKKSAQPLRFDTFEEMNVGDDIETASGGWWKNRVNASSFSVVSDEENRIGSRKSLKSSLRAQSGNYANPQFHRDNLGVGGARSKLFVSIWVRWEWPSWSAGEQVESTQTKAWRVAAQVDPTGNVHYPAIHSFNWMKTDYSYSWTTFNTAYSSQSGEGSLQRSFRNDHLVEGQWHNFVLQLDQGTAGRSDGELYAWLTREGQGYISANNVGPNQMVVDALGEYIDAVKVDNYLDANNKILLDQGHALSSTLYWDDIYIDNSWARVEIGDSAIYEECGKRNMQYPLSWSDNTIRVKVNTADFITGQQVYLFVVDENGAPSAGFGPLEVNNPYIAPRNPKNLHLSQ